LAALVPHVSARLRRRSDSQPSDDRYHRQAKADFVKRVTAKLRKQIRAGRSRARLCFDDASVSCAEAEKDGEEGELAKEKRAVARREKRTDA